MAQNPKPEKIQENAQTPAKEKSPAAKASLLALSSPLHVHGEDPKQTGSPVTLGSMCCSSGHIG